MAAHQTACDHAALPGYEFTLPARHAGPATPGHNRILHSMQGDQQAMDDFAELYAGMIHPADLFPATTDGAAGNRRGHPPRRAQISTTRPS